MDEKYTNFNGWEKYIDEKNKNSLVEKFTEKSQKNPTVREKQPLIN